MKFNISCRIWNYESSLIVNSDTSHVCPFIYRFQLRRESIAIIKREFPAGHHRKSMLMLDTPLSLNDCD